MINRGADHESGCEWISANLTQLAAKLYSEMYQEYNLKPSQFVLISVQCGNAAISSIRKDVNLNFPTNKNNDLQMLGV
ncbi:hypothetical protein NQ318_005864 [Aromia moschata]|uniref:Uncharacterized protein n=1 Tax=Aromia moschata TaxID=1265417 RepID=A0AAV8YTF7_9CUCU|nr:hypothetical protein NQ318_005864 [Aromia moschata]